MGFRETVARWLAPEVFENADRLDYMGERVRELRDWCAKDSPEVGEAARWVIENCRWHWMSLEAWRRELPLTDHTTMHLRGPIYQFRDWLRGREVAASDDCPATATAYGAEPSQAQRSEPPTTPIAEGR